MSIPEANMLDDHMGVETRVSHFPRIPPSQILSSRNQRKKKKTFEYFSFHPMNIVKDMYIRLVEFIIEF